MTSPAAPSLCRRDNYLCDIYKTRIKLMIYDDTIRKKTN